MGHAHDLGTLCLCLGSNLRSPNCACLFLPVLGEDMAWGSLWHGQCALSLCFLSLSVCLCMGACAYTWMHACLWKPEDKFSVVLQACSDFSSSSSLFTESPTGLELAS